MVNSALPPSSIPRVRARQISDRDIDGVVDLLTRGFRLRSRDYWRRALEKLSLHRTPAELPRYGYLLESGGDLVGVILLIFSAIPGAGAPRMRCNVSSWYVEPAFRSHASLLISQAIKHKNVTYVNVSPALHTRPIVEAQGFSRYSSGQFVAAPALSMSGPSGAVKVIGVDQRPAAHFEPGELELLRAHQELGCLSLWGVTSQAAHPFVFMPRRAKGVIPCVQLIYCRQISDFIRLARPIGRYLAARGRPLVIIDANGSIPGLIGKYVDGKAPKYFKGPDRPQFGDLAYTEAVLFGI
jgi:hypothetical protein